MLNITRVAIPMMLVFLLSACATVNPAKTQEQSQKVKTAKINAQLGIAYLERHNIQRAKQKLLLSLEQAPNIPETWYSMAYFLEATGNKDDASIYYQKAISVAPTRGDAQNNYGTFLCRNGDYRGAVEHFMLAVKDPTYLDPADAYENAGLCAMKIPDNKMAAKYFAEAIQQDPARTVSERKLRELNKGLLPAVEAPKSVIADATPPVQKRIAYKSLRNQHDEDDEDEDESGLVKIPDLLKSRPVAAAAPAPALAPEAAPDIIAAPVVKKVAKVTPKTKPAKVKMANFATRHKLVEAHKLQSSEFENPLMPKVSKTRRTAAAKTKVVAEKFQIERVALKPKLKKVAAQSKQHPKPAKMAARTKHKAVASTAKLTKHHSKAKATHAVAMKKQTPTEGTVTV